MELFEGIDGVLFWMIFYVILGAALVLFIQLIAYSTISFTNIKKRKKRDRWYPVWSKRLVDHIQKKDTIRKVEIKHSDRKAFRDLLILFYNDGMGDGKGAIRIDETKRRRLRLLYRDLGYIEDDLDQLRNGPWWKKTLAFGRLARLELNDGEDMALELITTKDSELAIAAISYLTVIDSKYLPEQLTNIYQWNEPWMHKEITLELVKLEVDPRNIRRLAEDPYPAVRKAAAMLSGRKDMRKLVPTLSKLAFDEDMDVRVETARSLGRIGGRSALKVLEGMVDDSEKDVRLTVAESIGCDPKTGVDSLELLAKDAEYDVKIMAFTNLSRKGWDGQAAILDLSKNDPEIGKEFI